MLLYIGLPHGVFCHIHGATFCTLTSSGVYLALDITADEPLGRILDGDFGLQSNQSVDQSNVAQYALLLNFRLSKNRNNFLELDMDFLL